MKAALLVGGVGTRLRPLTYLVPKPMLPLAGKPLLVRTLDYLKGYGFEDIVLCVAYLKKQIIDYFEDGSQFGVNIEYAESEEPLGTAGQLRTAKGLLEDEAFLAMNGDIFTSLSLGKLVSFHEEKGAYLSIALKRFDIKMPYGRIVTNGDEKITDFQEKPTISFMANAGIYVCDPGIFDYFPPRDPSNLEYDVFPRVIDDGNPVFGFKSEAFWGDIGKLSDYEKLNGMSHNDTLADMAKKNGSKSQLI